ncbi:MAG: HI1506-related protein [Gammaproteobacteria bacterium]|nr:HI1506-related protein [Gammaproteobacteria bacterium]
MAKSNQQTEAKAKTEAEAKAKTEAEAKAKTEAEAKAKAEAEAKAKTEAEAEAKTKEVDGVFVKCIRGKGSFRRAGFKFDETGFGIALDALSEEQLQALNDEPMLVVEECKVTITIKDGE